MILEEQYEDMEKTFVEGTAVHNDFSRSVYYKMLDFKVKGRKILDVGCGDGFDLKHFRERGAEVYGLDASKKLVNRARINVPEAAIRQGFMENLPYQDGFFDLVTSKYALQTSKELRRSLNEMDRVLKLDGTLAYLAVHPLRQFLEKKKHPKDYFLQEIVTSCFFGGTVTALEPSHTLEEYLNSDFLRKYRIEHYSEHPDFPSSEQVDGDHYPCFFLMKAVKIK